MTDALAPLSGVPVPAPASAPPTVAHVAKQFEAVFLRQMIGAMRQASLGDGLFDSSAGDQFRDLADARLADGMADQGGFGIATLLARQLGGDTARP